MAMTLKVWHTIISTTLEVRKLLDNALTPKGGETTVIGTVHQPISPAVRTRLRGELRRLGVAGPAAADFK